MPKHKTQQKQPLTDLGHSSGRQFENDPQRSKKYNKRRINTGFPKKNNSYIIINKLKYFDCFDKFKIGLYETFLRIIHF